MIGMVGPYRFWNRFGHVWAAPAMGWQRMGDPIRRPLQPPLYDGGHDHDRRIDSRSDKRRPNRHRPCGGENVIVCNIYNDSTPAVQDGIQGTALPSPAGSKPYRSAQSASRDGDDALTMLPDDSVSDAAWSAASR
jgi:hypothetical protein